MNIVSVIIPLCNKSQYIEETINCVLRQSWPNIEVIIIENNSSDNSYEIAKKHERRNITVIRSKKKGASAARNLGLKLSKGKYIQFLDADDLLSPYKIESQVREIGGSSDLAVSNWARFKNKYDSKNKFEREIPENDIVLYSPREFLEKQYMAPIHSWLCPASLIRKVGLWNEELSVNDDGDYFIRLIKESHRVIYVPELAYYRTDATFSLSQNKEAHAFESLYSSYVTFKKIVSQYNSPKLNKISNEKFGNLFLETYNNHNAIAKLCEQQISFNYKYCYSSMRNFSKMIACVLGIKCYLNLKNLSSRIV